MSAQASRLALVKSRVAAAALLSVLLVSCSSTSDSSLDVATPAFTDDPAQSAAAAEIAKAEGGPAEETRLVKSGAHAVTHPAEPAVTEAKPAEAAQAAAAAPDASEGKAEKATEEVLAAAAAPGDQQPIDPKKKTFLSSFFGSDTAAAAATPVPVRQEAAKPLVKLAATGQPKAKAILDLGEDGGGSFLPGVRSEGLFEIKRKSGSMTDDGDIDIHEDEEGPPVILASAAGLARLAPNGLLKQRESVDVACLKPALVGILKSVERHFGKKLIVTSGYRSPTYNRKVNGAKRSQHMYCAAADVQVPGVSKWELAKYVRSMPGRGGVGTYCHTASVHIDIGPERDWNWRCRRRT